eukprot:5364796-Pleurochrysis_carterae.AAC.2
MFALSENFRSRSLESCYEAPRGVINHGSADSVHTFPVAPNLAGNANLNCECLCRAIKADFQEKGILPQLHLQRRKHMPL